MKLLGLVRIQRKFAALCHNRFFQDIGYHYINTLYKLTVQTLHVRRRHIDALFLIYVFRGTKFCPCVLETVGLRVPTRNIRSFSMFSCSSSHCPTARCVSAANSVCNFVDIFTNSYLSLESLVWSFFLFFLLSCPLCVCFVLFAVLLFVFYIPCWLCNWPPAVELST
jgi:hypothetical protein